MEGQPKRTRHKLPPAAQRLLTERILAGDRNAQLRHHLTEAGFDGNLSRQALDYYRAAPQLREAGRLLDHETRQAHFSARAHRIFLLSDLITETQQRLSTGGTEEQGTSSIASQCRLYPILLHLLACIGVLMDSATETSSDAWMQLTALQKVERVHMTPTQKLALFNDMLEVALRNRGVVLEDDPIDPLTSQDGRRSAIGDTLPTAPDGG